MRQTSSMCIAAPGSVQVNQCNRLMGRTRSEYERWSTELCALLAYYNQRIDAAVHLGT